MVDGVGDVVEDGRVGVEALDLDGLELEALALELLRGKGRDLPDGDVVAESLKGCQRVVERTDGRLRSATVTNKQREEFWLRSLRNASAV